MVGKTHRVGKSVIEISQAFATEEACLMYLEAARWPDGVRCVTCGDKNISRFVAKGKSRFDKDGKLVTGPDRQLFQCLNSDCKQMFSAKAGTLFNDTHLPLNKWFMAIAIMCNAKKGASAKQMERDLGVSYKTAWYLCHRIRKAMEEGVGLFTGTVELDETYIGGRFDKRRARAKYDKAPVFGMLERETGKVSVKHVPVTPNRFLISKYIDKTIAPEAKMMTDESALYKNLTKRGFQREIVIHSGKEWVRGDCHTQNLDGFWSLLKRGIIGSYHQVSVKHLNRYISEFQFRFNAREDQEIFAAVVLNLVIKSALTYDKLTGKGKKRGPYRPRASKPSSE